MGSTYKKYNFSIDQSKKADLLSLPHWTMER